LNLSVCSFICQDSSKDSEVTFVVFESSCHSLTISLSVLPKDTTSELINLSSHYVFMFNAESQEEKLWIPNLGVLA